MINKFEIAEEIKLGEFVDLMCKAGVSQEEIVRQSARMDARLALDYFSAIYVLYIVAWGVFQTTIGHYIMAPISTALLLA